MQGTSKPLEAENTIEQLKLTDNYLGAEHCTLKRYKCSGRAGTENKCSFLRGTLWLGKALTMDMDDIYADERLD